MTVSPSAWLLSVKPLALVLGKLQLKATQFMAMCVPLELPPAPSPPILKPLPLPPNELLAGNRFLSPLCQAQQLERTIVESLSKKSQASSEWNQEGQPINMLPAPGCSLQAK